MASNFKPDPSQDKVDVLERKRLKSRLRLEIESARFTAKDERPLTFEPRILDPEEEFRIEEGRE